MGKSWLLVAVTSVLASCTAPRVCGDCEGGERACYDTLAEAKAQCPGAFNPDGTDAAADGQVPTDEGTSDAGDGPHSDSMFRQDAGDGSVALDAHHPDARPGDAASSDVGGHGGSDGHVSPPNDGSVIIHPDGSVPPEDGTVPPPDAALPPDASHCNPGCIAQCTPSPELCDGEDNDCDGETDEDFAGLNQPCFTGRGLCQAEGIVLCSQDHQSVVCSAVAEAPAPEACNGLDDDCDGNIDEELGDEREECGVGACHHTVTVCDGGQGVACDPLQGSQPEVCNGIDDDCDGVIDNGVLNACGVCGSVPVEICDRDDNNCDGAIDEGRVCTIIPPDAGLTPDAAMPPPDAGTDAELPDQGPPPPDAGPDAAPPVCDPIAQNDPTCDGIDDDCDGTADDEADEACACPMTPGIPYTQRCVDGVLQPCPCPTAEVCDGLDNDLNGRIDDVAGAGEACSAGQGACQDDGTQQCDIVNHLLVCNAVAGQPTPEVCDQIDNDCNGQVDDSLNLGADCSVGQGACLRHGTLVCGQNGEVVCSAQPGTPTPEACNGIDDNCDGEIDEGIFCPRWTPTVGGIQGNITEVTKSQYGSCVDAGVCPAPSHSGQAVACNWQVPGRLDHPINCVTVDEADLYCHWIGGRIPIQPEWRSLAGPQTYAWGNAPPPDCTRAHTNGCQPRTTRPATDLPAGASPVGAVQMHGNVREWTLTEQNGNLLTVGGGYEEGPVDLNWVIPLPGDRRSYDLGFRCVRDPAP